MARSKASPRDVWALDYVVERKSVNDLVKSIKDSGRYEKQKYALRRCGLRRVMYLLEGNPDIEVQGVRRRCSACKVSKEGLHVRQSCQQVPFPCFVCLMRLSCRFGVGAKRVTL